MNTQKDIEERLFNVGQSAHALLQFPPGINFVKELARYGAQRIADDHLLNDDDTIKLAEANFDHLLMRLADQISKGTVNKHISMDIISEILHELGLCPLFPFC